jgi:hypothetical protein
MPVSFTGVSLDAVFWAPQLTAAANAAVKTNQTPATPSAIAPVGGRLWSWIGSTTGAATYLQFFDIANGAPGSLVSGTTVPLFPGIALPIGSTTPQQIVGFFERGFPFKTGLCWATSTTPNVFTTSAVTISLSVEYS